METKTRKPGDRIVIALGFSDLDETFGTLRSSTVGGICDPGWYVDTPLRDGPIWLRNTEMRDA